MAENLQNQLKEVGSKLENPPASKDDLIKLLSQATESLSELDQSPPKALLDSMQPLLNAIVKPELLKHEDKEVSLLVAICTCEITRITAPEAPYDDDVLKDIFHLYVSTFNGLRDTKDPSFERRVIVLDTVAKYRSFVVMLDLECDDLINEMFKTFFTVARDEHHETVITAMETIMAVLLEESEEIEEDLLSIILSTLGRDKKDITAAARMLAMNVIKQSAGILEPGIKKFILSSMSGDNSSSNPQIDYHEVIYDIYRCAPQVLSKIVPNLKRELLTDKIDLRLKAVKLVGDLFSIKGSSIPQTFHPIFLEFLKKFNDKVVQVRMSVVEYAKLCLLSDPLRTEAPQLLASLSDKLSDDDESIRKQVVAVISDVASLDLSSISPETIKLLAEHLEDKSVLVKNYTLERLSDIYRTWCLKKIGGLNVNHDYDWIPGRILRSFFDKDFGPNTIEHILSSSLFPVELSVKDKVKNWVKLFSKFDKVEVNALEMILEERQRLQLELRKYLSIRETYKDSDASELQKKTTVCIRFMSHCLADPIKAEADFQILNQLKDDNIWKILTTLVDPNTSSLQSRSLRDELLKIIDEKHPLYELLSTLFIKSSYIIFDKDFVKNLLLETEQQKSDGNKLLIQSCMNLLVILSSFSPLLLSGIEEDLVHLLEDYDDEAIKDGVLHVLAKTGETIREQLGDSSSRLDLILERICLEGSRKQAKYAVHALVAITKDDVVKSLSVLYKRLVNGLEKRTNLPSVLQSLGCIAQIAMPVFETQESKIEEFIRKNILSCNHKPVNKAKKSWDNKSGLCSLKIFGIKTLVKSYLPVKDAHLRVGIDELLKDLHNILSFGEISKDVESSSVDKAHLKLASAKAIIRLSKHWDKKIPVDLFHLTLRTSEARFPQVRKLFLKKVHQYIKNRSLDPKYVCAFLLDFRSQKPIREEENQSLSEILEMCEQWKKANGNSSVYILPYLIHALAHHPSCPNIDECKDVKAYEPIFRKLYIYFSKLAAGNEDGKPGVGLKQEDVISIISVLRTIKFSKDAVDTNMSKNSYAICDLCLIIIKRLAQKHEDLYESVVPLTLPDELYTPHKKKEEEKEYENKEDEIEEVNKEDETIEEINKAEKKEDEKIEENNKDEKKEEEVNKEDEKMEEENKDEKEEEVNLEEEKKEDEKMEEDSKDEKKEEAINKEDEKMEEDNKDETKEEVSNKEEENKDEKMEVDNKEQKKEEINKEDEKKEETSKEDEKMEEDNKDEKMEEGSKHETKEEAINKEDEKMEEDSKDEKKEEVINKEEKKEDEKMEEGSKHETKEEAINKEDEKMEEDNKDEKKEEEINKEDEKMEEDDKGEKKVENINKEDQKIEEDKKDENKEHKKIEDEKKEDKTKEDEKIEEDNKDEKKEDENKDDEKKEEVSTEVTEGRTWLADESVFAHFESFILEANGNISSKVNEDDIMKDSETDGNEIPLGKVLKRLKAKGSKSRKEVKNGSTPKPKPKPTVETENNNVDIMGMLREINSDNLGVSVSTTKFDSSNGHGEIKTEADLKRKGIPEDLTNVPVPKRRRSTTSAKGHKRSSFITSGMKGGPTFSNKMDDGDGDDDEDDDGHSDSDDKVSLDRGVIHKEEAMITDEVDLEKPKTPVDIQKSGNLRKRKRRRVSRLVKCTADATEFKTKDLIGRRIKVWWPMDKEFYEGLVKSYDHENNKHVVLYDDGDIEVLCLDKERWKLVKSGHKLAERKLMTYSPPPKEGTSKKLKSSGSSKQTKESTDISPSSMVRGKRTPRQNLNQGQKGVSQRSAYLEIRRSKDPDASMPDIISSKIDNLDAVEAGAENSDKLEKSRSKENQTTGDAESSSNDSMSSHKNEPSSVQKETKNDDSAPSETHGSDSEESGESTDVQTPDGKESSTYDDSDMAGFTDDEPLGVWKARVGKSVEGK
ncbi:sister chromatid cohesion protein PDS5 homolog A isoform X1 [Lactuca sativa]|uniref:Tudor domain-containing protein n=1 Tax=Lactuca sativa TaxID=4236 RepID=A0A9R1VZU2_LACSA|nr:sister chromatid cohesion protein PDS5 homolog A isoform X1 [Lactuca sativa]KAJ0213626.1 hypothetical protein LSAT_V11C400181960 [Lactuca sativa]